MFRHNFNFCKDYLCTFNKKLPKVPNLIDNDTLKVLHFQDKNTRIVDINYEYGDCYDCIRT